MDPQQFDALSRTLAHASSRRQAMARVGTAGLLAGLATAFGRGRSHAAPAVQGETCRLAIVATVRVGPDATERMQTDVPGELRGEITFTLGSDGAIDEGRLLLDGGPEAPVIGQATGRAINLRAELEAIQEGLTLVLVGTAEQPLDRCRGAVDGLLTGPLPGDLGDWHATATAGGTRTSPAPLPSEQSCLRGLTRCGSVCVDLQTDVRNCSVCQLACSSGAACISGSCVCPPDRPSSCNGVCVDLSSDLNNCGACGEICASGLVPVECRSGVCERASCPVGIEYCGAADLCRDLSSDPLHCGACGNACPSGVCSGGVCQSVTIANIPLDEAPPDQTSCPPGLVYCGNGICVDVGFDSVNCGSCGFTCVGSERCEFGTCVPSVPIANIPLDEAPPDGISSCLPGLVYCGNGICVDIFIDSFNCGGCGITCPYPQGCQGGVCVG